MGYGTYHVSIDRSIYLSVYFISIHKIYIFSLSFSITHIRSFVRIAIDFWSILWKVLFFKFSYFFLFLILFGFNWCHSLDSWANKFYSKKYQNLPITTPSTLGPNALPKSGWRIGVDSNTSSGWSRKHFNNCEYDKSGEQLTWCDIIAAYLAGSLTRDHGDRPVPDSSIARWNSSPANEKEKLKENRKIQQQRSNELW